MTPEDAVVDAAAAVPQLDGYGPWTEVSEGNFGRAAADSRMATGYIEIVCGATTYCAYVIAHPNPQEKP